MKATPPVQLACARFTSCSGCQLMLLNCEEQLAGLADAVAFTTFELASSRRGEAAPVAVALVEGSISTPSELVRLLALRRRARWLVAVGACALTGGVNALAARDRNRAAQAVYGPSGAALESFPPQPQHHFIRVDGEVAGCPPERHELLSLVGALLHGGRPGHQEMPVCMECRLRELRCLLIEGRVPCLGPLTRAGCLARCPAVGTGCEGCRGAVAEANREEMFRLLLAAGLPEREIHRRLERFAGERHD